MIGFLRNLFCSSLQEENRELKAKVDTLEELTDELKTKNNELDSRISQLEHEIENYQEFISDIKQSDVL